MTTAPTTTARGTSPPRTAGDHSSPRKSMLRKRRPSSLAARLAWLIVMGLAALFFCVPVVWLLLAPTKTDSQIVRDSPFSFGSLGAVADTWQHLYAFQDGAILTWLLKKEFWKDVK